MHHAIATTLVLCSSCGRIGFDVARDATHAPADPCELDRAELGTWGTPAVIPAASDPAYDDDPAPSADGLELFFTSSRAPVQGPTDLWRMRRDSTTDPWGAPEKIVELSGANLENTPELSPHALTMWLVSDRPGGLGLEDIWVTTRADRDATWAPLENVAALNSPSLERAPSIFLDGLAIVFHSTRPGGAGGEDFWMSMRESEASPWSGPVPLASVNTPNSEARGWMSPCGLELVFQVDGGSMNPDFYRVTREQLADDFGPRERIDELSSAGYDEDLRLSPDRRRAVFSSSRDGQAELYEATR